MPLGANGRCKIGYWVRVSVRDLGLAKLHNTKSKVMIFIKYQSDCDSRCHRFDPGMSPQTVLQKAPRNRGFLLFRSIPVFFVFVRCFGRSVTGCDVNRAFCADKPRRACCVTQLDSGGGAVLAILRRAA